MPHTISLSRLQDTSNYDNDRNSISLGNGYIEHSLTDRSVNDNIVVRYTTLVQETEDGLTELHLKGYNNEITLVPVWKNLMTTIFYHVSIVELSLNCNVIASLQHVQIVTDMIRENPNIHIQKLDLSKHNNINFEGFALLFEALRNNQTIETLSISFSSTNRIFEAY